MEPLENDGTSIMPLEEFPIISEIWFRVDKKSFLPNDSIYIDLLEFFLNR